MLNRRQALGLALAMAAPKAAIGAPAGQVKLGIFSDTIFNLPIWIAEQKGYFRDAGVGFSLEQSTMALAHDALIGGSVPLAMLGPEVAFLDHRQEDKVRIIAGNANRLPHSLIAQPRFKRVQDLKGARFGVISQIEGTTYVVQRIASGAGLNRGDYEIAAVGGAPARVKLMDDGVIDAALQPFPLTYEAEAKGFSNLGWAGLVVPEWQFSVVLANRDWMQREPKEVAAVLKAAIRGRRLMEEDRPAASAIAAERLKTTPALARRALDDTLRLGIMDPQLRWSEAGLLEVYKTLQEAAVLPADQPFRLDDYVDGAPLSRALS